MASVQAAPLTLHQLLRRLEGVKPSGSGFLALCPLHKDTDPSLSISGGKDGQILLHCFAGCQLAGILACLHIEECQLFPRTKTTSNGVQHQNKTPPPPLSEAQVKAMSEALSKDGAAWKHVTETLRFSPEVIEYFRLGLHVGGGGRRFLAYLYRRGGAFTYANCRSLDGPKRFLRVPHGQETQLYLTDSLVEGGTAIVFEGERDALAAFTMNLHLQIGGCAGAVAVVSMPGVSQVEVAATALAKQRLLYLFTDSDPPGEKAAEELAKRLGPERCRRVRLNGFKDLGDALSALPLDQARALALEAFKAADASGPFGPREPAKAEASERRATMVCLADVEPEELRWLWEGRIPLGKITVIEGDPDLGKSTVALDIAARVSTGEPMPLSASTARATPAGVILLAHEDGLADTIRPRLDAAGANVSRVHAITVVRDANGEDQLPSLPEDIAELEACIERTKAALVIIDVLVAYLSPEVNTFKDQDVRRALMPLKAMAERTGVAVLLIRHLNKRPGGQALYRGGGSIGIIGAARSGMLVARDPDHEDVRVLAPVKHNLAAPQPSLRYQIVPADDDATVTRVKWLGESQHSADQLLAAAATGPGERDALEEAEEHLQAWLAEGPVESKELEKRAKDVGISWRTMQRAKRSLGIEAVKGKGAKAPWIWQLPGKDRQPTQVAPSPEDDAKSVGGNGSYPPQQRPPTQDRQTSLADLPTQTNANGDGDTDATW